MSFFDLFLVQQLLIRILLVELTGTAPVSSEHFALLHRYIVYIIQHFLSFVKDFFINSTEEEEYE